MSRLSGWADIGNSRVDEAYRRQGVRTVAGRPGRSWRRLGGVACLLDYADAEKVEMRRPQDAGFTVLTPNDPKALSSLIVWSR